MATIDTLNFELKRADKGSAAEAKKVKKAFDTLTNGQLKRLQDSIKEILDERDTEAASVTSALNELSAKGISKEKLQEMLEKM